MSKKMKLAGENFEAILEKLANSSNCSPGCKCIFCRTFDAGYKMGLEDAVTHAERHLANFASRLDKEKNLG